MADIKLKPCPFCGGEQAHLYKVTGLSTVACKDCCARSSFFSTKDEAIEAWNRRSNNA